jgi:hypothetical protein
VHNTLTVDGQDQMARAGRFLTLDWFPAYSKSLLEADERILGRMLAYHKGYRRRGVRHERIATVFTDEHWEIRDKVSLMKPGNHVFRLHWLMLDGKWRMENDGPGAQLSVATGKGTLQVRIRTEPASLGLQPSISIVRAGELVYGDRDHLPFEGWVSPTYGRKIPALSFAVQASSSTGLSFITEFIFP